MHQSLSIQTAFELFLLDEQSQGFTSHTLRFYNERLHLFLHWCAEQDVNNIDQLRALHIKRFFVHLQGRDLSSAYIHSHARAIKTFCKYCVRDNLIGDSPFSSVKMPKLEGKILPALSNDEIESILAVCITRRDRTIATFMLDSGVRATELVTLNVGDVDLKTGSVMVIQGKGQKDRMVFIGAKTRKLLILYLAERDNRNNEDPLFVSERSSERLTYYGLAQMLKRLRKACGVKECHAHAFRRTFAINCLRNGMDVYTLAKLMGHSGIIVLKQYLDLVRDDLANVHAKASPVDRMREKPSN
ncbi:hypothetical protein BH10CHL1_BH10CHL1_24290 [soil metagenome]